MVYGSFVVTEVDLVGFWMIGLVCYWAGFMSFLVYDGFGLN